MQGQTHAARTCWEGHQQIEARSVSRLLLWRICWERHQRIEAAIVGRVLVARTSWEVHQEVVTRVGM